MRRLFLSATIFALLSAVWNSGRKGRNVNIGPGYANWDFGALKNFRFTEAKQLQFRAEPL